MLSKKERLNDNIYDFVALPASSAVACDGWKLIRDSRMVNKIHEIKLKNRYTWISQDNPWDWYIYLQFVVDLSGKCR